MKLIEGICEYFFDLFKMCKTSSFQTGTLPVEYDQKNVIHHEVYSAEWSFISNDFKINSLYLDLSEGNNNFSVLLLENNNIIFIFKFIDNEYEILDKNGKKVPLELLGNLISSFEKMISLGFGWKPAKSNQELFDIACNFI
jgi:hypothetical protein